MIDINLLRSNLDDIVSRLKNRGLPADFVPRFRTLEGTRKNLQARTEQTQAKRNQCAKMIGQLKAKKTAENDPELVKMMAEATSLGNELKRDESALELLQQEIKQLLEIVPNIPHETVPPGGSSEQNVERRRWGTPRKFEFLVKDHVDVGTPLGLDFETGAKLAGARFAVMKGQLARLHRALAQFMLDVHTSEHGYTETYTPYMVSGECANGVSSLAKFKGDLFKLEERDLYLIPTAEYSVTNFVRDEILPLESLPLKYVCHSPCFRSEAGAAGKDTRGMIRNHQFDKVELVQIIHPAKSYEGLEALTAHAETILRKLELPYRVVELCAGDMGFSAAKTYDLEVWLPGQNAYREISSCSNFEAFQARRMQARFRNAQGKPEPVHTLNGSGLAVGRTLVAILENYQNTDGSVSIPAVLRSHMGGAEKLARP